MNKSDKIKQWLWNIFSAGLPVDYDLEVLRKIFLINLMVLVGGFFLILFSVIEFILQDYFLCVVDLVFFFIVLWLFIYLRKTVNYNFVGLISATLIGLFYFFYIAYGGMGNTAYLWSFTYPLITIFLLGTKKGTIFSLILLFMACVVFVFESKVAFFTSYDAYLKMRFIPAYLLVYLLAFMMEKTRRIVASRLEFSKSEIEKTVEKLEGTNKALSLNENRLRQIIDLVPHFIFAKDSDGRFILANQAVAEAYGTTVQELVGKCGADFSASEEEARHFREDDNEVIRSGVRKVIKEEQITDAVGKTRILSTHKVPFTFSGATGPAVLGVSMDITELKRAEMKAKDGEERAKRQRSAITKLVLDESIVNGETDSALHKITKIIANTANVERSSVWTLDESGSELKCLSLFEVKTGTHSSGATLKAIKLPRYFAAIHQESRIYAEHAQEDRRMSELTENYLKPLGITSMLDAGIIIDGQLKGVVCLEHVGKPRVWHSDEEAFASTVASMVAQFFIVIERKRAEEALTESEKRYRLLADNVSDNLWVFDLSTMRFSYVSPSVTNITGFTAEEVTGFQLQDTLTSKSLELANQVLAEELVEAVHYYDPERSRTIELEQYRKDGKTVWTEASTKFIYDNENRPISILGVTRDISERKRLQQQLHKAQKMESIGLLAGGVAHDLNNVLSGIVSYPELILMNLPEDSKLRKPLKTMMESGLRATAIVQDLLTMARGVAMANEPLNLNDLIREYLSSPECDMLKSNHPAITIKTGLDPSLLNIGGSPVHVRKMIMNVVSNAAEAIKESGNITISTANRYIDKPLQGYHEISQGECAVLSVADDGHGISSEDLERIFEPFFTKKKLGRSGTGLGLAVAWNVMQDHKGYIDVTTGENGTIFELYFPITRDAVLKKDLPLSIDAYKGNDEKILVVDDVESQREISCKILDTLGYKTTSVSSGEEAIEYLKKNAADLIVLDMIMDPGISGHETYKQIIQLHPAQKAIIVSGFSETEDVKKTQALGAGKYIKKPLTIERLGIAVKEELAK